MDFVSTHLNQACAASRKRTRRMDNGSVCIPFSRFSSPKVSPGGSWRTWSVVWGGLIYDAVRISALFPQRMWRHFAFSYPLPLKKKQESSFLVLVVVVALSIGNGKVCPGPTKKKKAAPAQGRIPGGERHCRKLLPRSLFCDHCVIFTFTTSSGKLRTRERARSRFCSRESLLHFRTAGSFHQSGMALGGRNDFASVVKGFDGVETNRANEPLSVVTIPFFQL